MISPHAQRGCSLVASIFLVVVVAMIAGFMVNIGTLQQAETTLGLMGLRANAAAGSGLEWALARVLAANSCPAPGTAFALKVVPFRRGLSSLPLPARERAGVRGQSSTAYAMRTLLP